MTDEVRSECDQTIIYGPLAQGEFSLECAS